MHLYVVLARFLGEGARPLPEVKAAIELLKSEHDAESRGPAPMGLGLVYETPAPVPEADMSTLGVVEFR